MSTCRIRFVGGPWHNRLEDVQLVPCLAVRSASGIPAGIATIYPAARYHLAQYITKAGTRYYQYVHTSLLQGQYAHECTHRERFPVWRINKRKLEAQIRRRMKWNTTSSARSSNG